MPKMKSSYQSSLMHRFDWSNCSKYIYFFYGIQVADTLQQLTVYIFTTEYSKLSCSFYLPFRSRLAPLT